MSKVSKKPSHLRVFLCHSSSDKGTVRELYQRLVNSGFKPWLDEIDILPGQDWEAEITKAVRNSDIVLVCLSCGSINKEGFVQKEIKFALDIAQEKPDDTIFLIPVRLEECDIPARLTKLQWVNYFKDGGYERLVLALQKRATQIGVKRKGRPPRFSSPLQPTPTEPLQLGPSRDPVPQNLFQAFLQIFWGWRPLWRNTILILIVTVTLGFLVWEAFPESVKIGLLNGEVKNNSSQLDNNSQTNSNTSQIPDNTNSSPSSTNSNPGAINYFNQGKDLYIQEKYAEAEVAYRKAVELDPNIAHYHSNLGEVLYDQERYAEAEVAYRKAVELDPNKSEYHNDLGDTLYNQKKYAEAVAALRKAIELEPNKSEYHNDLGNALLVRKKYAEAQAAYRNAVELDPNTSVYHGNLGVALSDQKKYAEAVAALRKAIELEPNTAHYYNNLGIALYAQKKYAEAQAAYRKAVELNPNISVYHSNLGEALYLQKEYAEAEAAFRKAIELEPNITRYYDNLGATLNRQKKYAEAEVAYKSARRINK